jgi:tubulin-specific chaperone D
VICEVLKSGPTYETQVNLTEILKILHAVGIQQTLIKNTVVRKFRTKLVSRVALRLLPPKSRLPRRKGKQHQLFVIFC